MTVESPYCLHDQKRFSRTQEPPTTEASQLKLFRTVTNQSQTSAGAGEEKEDKTSETSGHPNSLTCKHKTAIKIKKQKTKSKYILFIMAKKTSHPPLHT